MKSQPVKVDSVPNANFKFEIDTFNLSVLFKHFAWDIHGKKIATLCKNEFYTSENHLIKYSSNRNIPTGMYLLKIQAENATTNYTKLFSE